MRSLKSLRFCCNKPERVSPRSWLFSKKKTYCHYFWANTFCFFWNAVFFKQSLTKRTTALILSMPPCQLPPMSTTAKIHSPIWEVPGRTPTRITRAALESQENTTTSTPITSRQPADPLQWLQIPAEVSLQAIRSLSGKIGWKNEFPGSRSGRRHAHAVADMQLGKHL